MNSPAAAVANNGRISHKVDLLEVQIWTTSIYATNRDEDENVHIFVRKKNGRKQAKKPVQRGRKKDKRTLRGTTLYLGGEEGPNSKISCIPGHASRVLCVDTKTDEVYPIGPEFDASNMVLSRKVQMVAWDYSWWYHIRPSLSCRLSPPHWHKNRWSWCDRNSISRLLWQFNSREWRWNTNGSLSRTTFTMEVSRRSNFPTWQMHLCYSTVLQEGPSIQSSDGRVFLCWTKVWRKVQMVWRSGWK